MLYFSEIDDFKTYDGKEDDFHFIYNANTGGGQSFLGGKFRDAVGNLVSPSALNGRLATFKFSFVDHENISRSVVLDDDSVKYEIKPRATGDSNMKFSVGTKPTPSKAVSSFLMLPDTCGVKRSANIANSILSSNNYWLQSMWLEADMSTAGVAIITPRDCILSGGIGENGGVARHFSVDVNKRMSHIMMFAEDSSLDGEILARLQLFADIYKGVTKYNYELCVGAIKELMQLLASKYPDRYSGTTDPLVLISELSGITEDSANQRNQPEARQLITYGAPGSGKSWSVKELTKGEDTIRTTFHPDSDYSTFVGSYKPSVEKDKFQTVVTAGERNAAGTLNKKDELFTQKRIVYKFIAQSFIKAYVDAWKYKAVANGGEATRKYLVIEEINRGNCAQIFGDLFQLLDRNDEGFSDYEIAADDDLQNYLAEQFADLAKQNETEPINLGIDAKLAKRILSGAVMLLPENLYIWATMNTSDQSLFPIDSAFKRRWEWKYMPIYDAQKDYKIVVDGDVYKWWDFLDKANALVQEFTDSEDKKLGYFFCKADASNAIPLEQFVGKVIFYLWNDVFKDAGFDHAAFDGDNGERLLFKTFFNPDGSPKAATVKRLMQNLGVSKVEGEGA